MNAKALGLLLRGLGARIEGNADVRIESIVYDSRRVTPGALFVALRGLKSDGHTHVAAALAAGARAVLVDRDVSVNLGSAALARVADTRPALPHVAARFYGEPGQQLTLIGVTGTNGKTSSVRLTESILQAAGFSAGSLGTISAHYAGREEKAELTTPESVELQATLRRMVDAGVSHVAMEVSSHSLAAGRVATLSFAAAAFTNLTHDHLDFHHTMESYAEAKAKLFDAELLAGTAVLPVADRESERFAARAKAGGRDVIHYGRAGSAGADVRSENEQIGLAGSRFVLHTPRGHTPVDLAVAGDFQLSNALTAAAIAETLHLPLDAIARGLSECVSVPGRLERVSPQRPAVFVDYAHTPDALDRVLATLRPLAHARLICVFGCGGDRDRTKRVPMARIACQHSDSVIATSDNPRTENPDAILSEIAGGLSGASRIVPDRREAIALAISQAAEDDVVLIAGKGHEDYQILGTKRVHFDDREEARAALAARGPEARS